MEAESEPELFTAAPEFAAALDHHTTVRIIVNPDDPLRGRKHHDGRVTDLDEQDDTLMVTVTAEELFEGSFSGEYERRDVEYRFTLPTDAPPSESITVERNVADEYAAPEWCDRGTLVGGGVLQMFGAED